MKKNRPLWKKILFPLAAIVLGLAPFAIAEVACRIFDWGRPSRFDDPYIGFSDIHPLFELNQSNKRYEIPEARLKFFCPESFSAVKPPNEFRIFVLGGSTVQGRPYQKETSFTTWLELSLNAADNTRRWEVVNCGGISYASYRLVPIMKEVLRYQPDLLIVCTGQNEFLEDRSYSHIKNASPILTWPHRQVSHLRIFNLMRGGYLALTASPETISPQRPKLGPEADARLDWKGGLDDYHRDETWRGKVKGHYAFNLSRMTTIAEEAEVPLLFVCPVANLDWPPFKSEHRADLSQRKRNEFSALMKKARDADNTSLEQVRVLRKAVDLDDRFALAHYEIAKRYQQLGMPRQARKAFAKALQEDICPLRMLPEMRDDLLRIADETETPLLNAQELFTERSANGITGSRWLLDHIHPTVEGHQLIAGEIVAMMTKQQMLNAAPVTKESRRQIYEKHLESLAPGYFARGLERLKGLKRWAYGRVKFERKN